MPKLTVPAFLSSLASDALDQLPLFREVFREKGGKYIAIGREVGGQSFTFLDFSGGYHRRLVGCGVGWCPSKSEFLEWKQRRENDPIQIYDGSMRRLERLEMPRDFTYAEVHRTIASLHVPMQELDLDKSDPESIREVILGEICQYGLPYLSLMLSKRHSMIIGVDELSGRKQQ